MKQAMLMTAALALAAGIAFAAGVASVISAQWGFNQQQEYAVLHQRVNVLWAAYGERAAQALERRWGNEDNGTAPDTDTP